MYPVTFEADYAEKRNRLTTFFRGLVAIPVMIVAAIYAIAIVFTVPIAWLALVFTGRYPQGLYDFNAKFLRLITRGNSFYYLLTDASPPLNGNPDDSYPVRVGIAPPKESCSRAKVFFRGLVGIPVMLLAYVWALIAAVVALIAWFAVLFTGKLSEGLFKPLRQGLTYQARANAYFMLLTEDWPPFSDEESGQAPQAQLPGASAAAGEAPVAAEQSQQQ
jgi:hypothetical protein